MGILSFFRELFGSEPQPEPKKKPKSVAAKPARKSEVAEITERTRQQIKATSQRSTTKKESPTATSETRRKPKKRQSPQKSVDGAVDNKPKSQHKTSAVKKKPIQSKVSPPAKPAPEKPQND